MERPPHQTALPLWWPDISQQGTSQTRDTLKITSSRLKPAPEETWIFLTQLCFCFSYYRRNAVRLRCCGQYSGLQHILLDRKLYCTRVWMKLTESCRSCGWLPLTVFSSLMSLKSNFKTLKHKIVYCIGGVSVIPQK